MLLLVFCVADAKREATRSPRPLIWMYSVGEKIGRIRTMLSRSRQL